MPLTVPTQGSRLLASRTSATAAITNVETQALSTPIPANFLAVGDVLQVTFFGTYAASAAGTVTYRLRYGTANTTADTAIVVHGPTASGGTATISLRGEFWITLRTVGATGTLIAAQSTIGPPVGALLGPSSATTTTTINTAVSSFLGLTVATSVATANVTIHQAFTELMR
jgi:hypothetical protein